MFDWLCWKKPKKIVIGKSVAYSKRSNMHVVFYVPSVHRSSEYTYSKEKPLTESHAYMRRTESNALSLPLESYWISPDEDDMYLSVEHTLVLPPDVFECMRAMLAAAVKAHAIAPDVTLVVSTCDHLQVEVCQDDDVNLALASRRDHFGLHVEHAMHVNAQWFV